MNLKTANIIIFSITLCILVCWIIYVVRNSFQIILPGLKSSYYIFFFHLALLILTIVLIVSSFITFKLLSFDSVRFACWMWPRFVHLIVSVIWYSVTMFGYQKAKIYFQMYIPRFQAFFSIFVHYVGVFLYIGLVCSMKTRRYRQGGYLFQACVKQHGVYHMMFLLCIIHYLICNLVVLYVILHYAKPIRKSLQSLEPQFQINEKFVPLFVLSDIFVMLILCTVYLSANKRFPGDTCFTIFWSMFFLDTLLNNAIMHYTVFAHVEFIHGEQRIRALMEPRDLVTFEESEELESERFYWIALPGLQPIQVSEELVRDNDLWDHVVTDANVLLQIERFKKMSCYSTLCWTCSTEDELFKMIEMFE